MRNTEIYLYLMIKIIKYIIILSDKEKRSGINFVGFQYICLVGNRLGINFVVFQYICLVIIYLLLVYLMNIYTDIQYLYQCNFTYFPLH